MRHPVRSLASAEALAAARSLGSKRDIFQIPDGTSSWRSSPFSISAPIICRFTRQISALVQCSALESGRIGSNLLFYPGRASGGNQDIFSPNLTQYMHRLENLRSALHRTHTIFGLDAQQICSCEIRHSADPVSGSRKLRWLSSAELHLLHHERPQY